ncbi:muts domain V-domain-containing protein [Pseudomassariella vexata]|uniref:DNA mismatch repair protein MSH5 n=1 Tax=Pseudomassariella vexata TaxID=1141098 RepID=A0A1Y2E4Q9_9PEZI|nr:muts domain V-domain-containing protein [Pseudomassariella vexata]ORY66344.1 muts domain V-domain-containing protein [Pseudomassariella vexata]
MSQSGQASGPPSRATPRTASRSSIYSPQLPAHPQRSRLSLRPSSFRGSSANPSQRNDDGDEADDPFPEDADALSEVIMALDMKANGNLGCAYYIAADEILLLLEDVAMARAEVIETLLLHARPTTVLTPSRTSETLADLLAKCAHDVDRDDESDDQRSGVPGPYALRILKSADFRYESAKEKLLGLEIQTQGERSMLYASVTDEGVDAGDEYGEQQGSAQGSLMRLGTSVNLDSHAAIGCAGAILGELQRRRTVQYLPNDPDALVAFRIRSVEMFTLFDSMFINADALVSLQILRSELHPNSQMRGPDKSSLGAKESLSVYGLFHHLACTPQGKSKLRQIFLRPSIDMDVINSRQRTISFLLRPDHAEAVTELTKDLRKIKNMRKSISDLRKGVDNPGRKVSMTNNVWSILQRFALHALNIRSILGQMHGAERINAIGKVVEVLQPYAIHKIGEMISQTIDFEQSAERGRTAVKQGVDANLDEMKQNYDGMEQLLTEVNEKLQRDLPEWAQRYVQNCVFLPQLGFLTVVSLNPETGKGNYEGEGLNDIWERMFAAEGSVYCKNSQMKEMDEQFGDAYCMIIDREIEIIHELSVRVLEHEDVILATSDVLGEFDSVLALAVGSGKYNWVAPQMTTENVLQIEGGRHPLQELMVSSFISNDCYMCGGHGDQDQLGDASSVNMPDHEEHPSTLILTGPNHSGKSVYLKQVALIVYLAHIGCFVPAESARIGITDQILTRIATRESVTRQESAFAIDLRQAAFAMNFATHRSLVLVDEFGKGTNSVDGAGLVTALLEHFTSQGPNRPKLLAATHFHEIFESDLLPPSAELAFAHMEVRIDAEAAETEDQVTYLYNLTPGRSVSSFGSRCAAMNGIDAAIVERAEEITLMLVRNEDLEAACTALSDAETVKLEQAEQVARAFLEQDVGPRQMSGRGRGSKSGHWYRNTLEKILSVDSSISDDT